MKSGSCERKPHEADGKKEGIYMTERESMLLHSYFYNNLTMLEDTVKTLQTNIRFREISVTDCVELLCAIQQLETFKNVYNDVFSLLKL